MSSDARAPADYSDLITKVIPAGSDCIVQSFLSCQECLAFLVFKFSKSVWGVNQIIVCLSGRKLSTNPSSADTSAALFLFFIQFFIGFQGLFDFLFVCKSGRGVFDKD